MSSRLGLVLLLAALAVPGVASASEGSYATTIDREEAVVLAQGKSDDAKGKARGKAREKAAKKAEKAAEKSAKKAEKREEKEERKAQAGRPPEGPKGLPPVTPPPGGGDDVGSPTGEDGANPLSDASRREVEKHQRRMAKIERIESLATTSNNQKLMARATHLRELEERRHEASLERLAKRGGKGPKADEASGGKGHKRGADKGKKGEGSK